MEADAGDITLPRPSDQRGGTDLPLSLAYDGGGYSLTETGILTRFDAKTGKQSYKSRLDGKRPLLHVWTA